MTQPATPNSAPESCIHCGYQRPQTGGIVTLRSCPRCKRPFGSPVQSNSPLQRGEESWIREHAPILQRWLTMVLIASVLCWMLGVWRRGAKLTPAQIDPALHQNPKQTSTERKPFHFRYRKVGYQVKPVANYELWGLVMSHNNIRSWWDVYHDADSVDTKDLCVIWGKNVKRSDFRKASFRSGAWTCYVRWPGGTQIFPDQLSNNHLVTRTQAIRRMIAKVRIGDQVHIKGMLVNYKRSDSRSPFWRRSSLSRKDEGNTACEVVFVEELRILVRGTPFWYFLASLGFWLFVLSLLAKFGVVVWRSRADRRPEHV